MSPGPTRSPDVWDGWWAGSPAWWCWMCVRGRSEVSMVLSRGARHCLLATRALGPPTTWEEAATQPSLRRHAPQLPALTTAVNRISMICEVACRLQTLSGSAGPPGSSPGSSD